MAISIIVLSGRVCSGKTSLADLFETNHNAKILKTKDLIKSTLPNKIFSREELQKAGDALDEIDGGAWVANALKKCIDELNIKPEVVILDSARIPGQLIALRKAFGGALTHVHLSANKIKLDERYKKRRSDNQEFNSYQELEDASETERGVDQLANLADVMIETDKSEANDVYTRVSARIGVRPGIASPCVDVIIGGQYGSEGKGNVVHYLAPEYDVLVRVGGPNAGHKVFDDNDEIYTFHQVPSGAIANPRAMLVLGAGAVISLEQLQKEITDLKLKPERLMIDGQAMIIEPSDIEWERKELKDAMGSTASGVGSATSRKILGRNPAKLPRLARDVIELQPYIKDTVEYFATSIAQGLRIMLEGTQGTSLSLHHGKYPHVTSRITTAVGCLAEAGISAKHVRKVVMVCRTFPIRVGNTDSGKSSGDMNQEIDLQEIASRSGIPIEELTRTERTSTTNRGRRIAEFDWAQFRRAVVLNGPTDIALTFVDYLGIENRDAYRYERLNAGTLRFIEELEKVGGLPVSLISKAFSTRNIIDRRAWSNSRYIELKTNEY
jgi:adenylosuccinate synthase